MRKQVILIMEGSQYPFGQADESPGNKSKLQSRILVRKKHETRSLQQRNQILDKIHLIKNISNTHLMKIQTVLQQQNSIHILYQYVPNCLVKQIKTLSESVIQKIRDQLWELGNILGDIGVTVEWDRKNIGISLKMETKYYLDLETIKIDNKVGKNVIQKQHYQAIMILFPQLVEQKQNPIEKNFDKQLYLPIGTKKTDISTNSLLYAREANSIDSKCDIQNLKRQMEIQIKSQSNNIKKQDSFKTPERPTQKIKSKQEVRNNRAQKIEMMQRQKHIAKQQEPPKVPMKKSRNNWKQIDQNSEFMQDIMNVLDDKSEIAKSKYIFDQFDEVLEDKPPQKKNQKNNYSNNNDQQQEIVWISAPENQHREDQQDKNRSEDEEIVWVDYRDFRDIRERAKAAIRRSSNALQIFRNIISKYK